MVISRVRLAGLPGQEPRRKMPSPAPPAPALPSGRSAIPQPATAEVLAPMSIGAPLRELSRRVRYSRPIPVSRPLSRGYFLGCPESASGSWASGARGPRSAAPRSPMPPISSNSSASGSSGLTSPSPAERSTSPGNGSYAWGAHTLISGVESTGLHFEVTMASNGQSLDPFNSGNFYISNASAISTSFASSSTTSSSTSSTVSSSSSTTLSISSTTSFTSSTSSPYLAEGPARLFVLFGTAIGGQVELQSRHWWS